MNNKAKDLKLKELKLKSLEKQLNELESPSSKFFHSIKTIALLMIVVCILFRTCYINDSLAIYSGTENTENNDAPTNITEDDENGPYDLDENYDNENNDNEKANSEKDDNKKDGNQKDDNENNDNNDEKDNEEPEIIIEPLKPEEVKKIKMIQETNNDGTEIKREEFSKLNNLSIFKVNNGNESEEKLVYPGISGKYKFYIENYLDKNIGYKLTFYVENVKNINMLYKLKRNGQYIVGNESNYVLPEKLNQSLLKLKAKQGDIYTLEWKWVESVNDNNATDKLTRSTYKITIQGEVL